jgi:predicted metal-dependent hydrolase
MHHASTVPRHIHKHYQHDKIMVSKFQFESVRNTDTRAAPHQHAEGHRRAQAEGDSSRHPDAAAGEIPEAT